MFDLKAFFGLSLPLTVSAYSLVQTMSGGPALLSLPLSVGIFAIFLVIAVVGIMYISEKEEKKLISKHLGE